MCKTKLIQTYLMKVHFISNQHKISYNIDVRTGFLMFQKLSA